MDKLPPREKVAEAYTAIIDRRVYINTDSAKVKSSELNKEYLIKWKDNVYYSNDNSSYWQGYLGYPVIAVLMLQNKLSLNREIALYFKGVEWNKLNKENKRDYKKVVELIIGNLKVEKKEKIYLELDKVVEEIKNLDVKLTRKKNLG